VGRAGLFPAYFLAPQKPEEARALFAAVLQDAQITEQAAPAALPGPQRTSMIIHLAREWELDGVARVLGEAADREYEPTWDLERGELTWGFGLGEEHPRGQFNAAMAAAEAVREHAWSRLFNVATAGRFEEPTVSGVEFPDVVLTQAWWDVRARRLFLATAPRNDRVLGRPTTFRLSRLGDAASWTVEASDDAPVTATLRDGELEVATTIGAHAFVAHPA
jgi:hypothetical protein